MGVAKKGINRVVSGYADLFDMLGGIIRWDIEGSLDKINTRHKRIKEVDKHMDREKEKAKKQKAQEKAKEQKRPKCNTGQLTL